MTGRKNRTLQVSSVVPYKALEKFSKALYGTTGDTCCTRFFGPVMHNLVVFGQESWLTPYEMCFLS